MPVECAAKAVMAGRDARRQREAVLPWMYLHAEWDSALANADEPIDAQVGADQAYVRDMAGRQRQMRNRVVQTQSAVAGGEGDGQRHGQIDACMAVPSVAIDRHGAHGMTRHGDQAVLAPRGCRCAAPPWRGRRSGLNG